GQKLYYTTYGGINLYDVVTGGSQYLFSVPYAYDFAVDTYNNTFFCSMNAMGGLMDRLLFNIIWREIR
ncbi:MAG: hypothetical protein AAFO91_00570, partial [Bacteroidota bacterium]